MSVTASGAIPYASPGVVVGRSARLASLDVFRGMTIAGMLLVNNMGGPKYGPFEHAEWHGWTATDLVFPFFAFIMGVAIPFSFAKRAEGETRGDLFRHALARGLALFLIGEFLYSIPSLPYPAPAGGHLFRYVFAYSFLAIGFVVLLYPWKSKRVAVRVPVIMAGAFIVVLAGFAILNKVLVSRGVVAADFNFGGGMLTPSKLRVPGVLQRLGVCYAVAAGVTLLFNRPGKREDLPPREEGAAARTPSEEVAAARAGDVTAADPAGGDGVTSDAPAPAAVVEKEAVVVGPPVEESAPLMRASPVVAPTAGWKSIAAVVFVLLAGYAALMLAVPYKSLVSGEWVRGKLDREDNLARFVDETVLGSPKRPVFWGSHTYGAYPDPEGILSTIPAIGTTLLGVLTGMWLRTGRGLAERCAGMFTMGVIGCILGAYLDWALMPINKQIWTSSYVVWCAGLSLMGLGAYFYLVDVLGYRKLFAPFAWYGMNAIAAFVLAGIVPRVTQMVRWPDPEREGKVITLAAVWSSSVKEFGKNATAWLEAHHVPFGDAAKNGSLAYALSFVLVFLVIVAGMRVCRIYLKV